MNSKVIKWLKRQSSIRKISGKEDKEAKQSSSEEKRRISLPQFKIIRKCMKRSSSKIPNETNDTLPSVSISKRLSNSAPKQIESNFRSRTASPVNESLSYESSSMASYQLDSNKDGSASDLSYHSFYDNYNSIKSPSNEFICKSEYGYFNAVSKSQSPVEINGHETPQSTNRSIEYMKVTNTLTTLPADHNDIENVSNGAPLVRMEEICDIVTDKEYPVYSLKLNKVDNSVISTSECSSPALSYISTEKHIHPCHDSYSNSSTSCASSIIDQQMEEDDSFIDENTLKSTLTVKIMRNNTEINGEDKSLEKVEDLPSVNTENQYNAQTFNKPEIIIKESIVSTVKVEPHAKKYVPEKRKVSTENKNELTESSDFLNEIQNLANSIKSLENSFPENKSQDEFKKVQEKSTCEDPEKEGQTPQDDSASSVEYNTTIETFSHISSNSLEIDKNLSSPENEIPSVENEIPPPENEIPPPENEIPPVESEENSDHSNKIKSNVEINVILASPQKSNEQDSLEYPDDLNPFGEEDEESSKTSLGNENKIVTPRIHTNGIKENGNHTKDDSKNMKNGTKINESKAPSNAEERHTCNCKKVLQSSVRSQSTNPFGDSDDEEENEKPVNSTNPFDDEEDDPDPESEFETPPRLPPKSTDLQMRLQSRTIIPIPRPRKSKTSLHGSYTSLQNVSMYPVPAPRSSFGSTKTLNSHQSTNPFEDDMDEEDLDRNGLQRCSLRMGASTSALTPLQRAGVRGSLPLSNKYRRKNRPAPLPPSGLSRNKPPISPFQRTSDGSFLRTRSSTFSTSSHRLSSGRDPSPSKLPPPRPPPPRF